MQIAQTLTCTIKELDPYGAPVIVTWTDPSNAPVLNTQTSDYVVTSGTVDGGGVQNAEVTITEAKLAAFAGHSSFTFRCSVGYSGSPESTAIDVIGNLISLELGTFCSALRKLTLSLSSS